MSRLEDLSMKNEPTIKESEAIDNRLICVVITANATYSLSPDMHNRAYEAIGIADQFTYKPLSVTEEELERTIEGFRNDEKFRGISVGVPHKQAVMPLLDHIDPAAIKIGAVNTIVIDRENGNTVLTGYNTDWIGIREPLLKRIELKGKRVAIVGAGGAARAATYAVLQEGATVKIYNRTLDKAKALAQDFNCEAGSLDDLTEIQEADIIIHATNQGMKPGDPMLIPEDFIQPHHVFFDVVYHRDVPETNLYKAARRKGATVIGGREMLLWQGVEQFRLFTGRDAPVEVMEKAII